MHWVCNYCFTETLGIVASLHYFMCSCECLHPLIVHFGLLSWFETAAHEFSNSFRLCLGHCSELWVGIPSVLILQFTAYLFFFTCLHMCSYIPLYVCMHVLLNCTAVIFGTWFAYLLSHDHFMLYWNLVSTAYIYVCVYTCICVCCDAWCVIHVVCLDMVTCALPIYVYTCACISMRHCYLVAVWFFKCTLFLCFEHCYSLIC